MLSITIEIQWAETGFRICSLVMGLFTLLMVGCSILYALGQQADSISVIFLAVFILSYSLPLFLNIAKLKFCDFVKGVFYVIYLSPTYVNIFTIYAIGNIHDVTWGSRPSVLSNEAMKQTEKKKEMEYKNYRSQFLVFWAICNCAFAYGALSVFEGGNVRIVLYIGAFLVAVMLFKIVVSLCHMVKARYDRYKVDQKIKTKTSTVFENVEQELEKAKDEVFVIYYEDEGGSNNLRISNKDDPKYMFSEVKSSILSDNIYRGFSVADLNRKHRISQGLNNSDMRGTTGFRITNGSMKWYDEESSSVFPEEPISSDISKSMGRKESIDLPGITSKRRNVNKIAFDPPSTTM